MIWLNLAVVWTVACLTLWVVIVLVRRQESPGYDIEAWVRDQRADDHRLADDLGIRLPENCGCGYCSRRRR